MPGIPPEVACPHCGGYVRGHRWIGRQDCSITNMTEFHTPEQVRLVLRDPLGRPVVDVMAEPGQRIEVGRGMPSGMLAVGFVDVLSQGQALPDPPRPPGGGPAGPSPEPPGP